MRDDELLAQLEQLDPTRSEAPPSPGSPHYISILEHAMNLTLEPEHELDTETLPSRRRTRRWMMVAAAAACVVAVTAGAVVLRPGHEPSAEAAVNEAAAALAEVSSLRANLHFEDDDDVSDVTVEAAGHDRKVVQEMRAVGSDQTDTFRWIVVDGTEYYTATYDGHEQTTAGPLDPNYELAPFGEASSAVVDAALEGSDAEEIGTEDVRGVQATHYRIHLAQPAQSALAALPRAQRGWFDLSFEVDYHAEDVTIDIWVADDIVRRISVSSPAGTLSAEYFDFNADITITPPPPPYVDPPVESQDAVTVGQTD